MIGILSTAGPDEGDMKSLCVYVQICMSFCICVYVFIFVYVNIGVGLAFESASWQSLG